MSKKLIVTSLIALLLLGTTVLAQAKSIRYEFTTSAYPGTPGDLPELEWYLPCAYNQAFVTGTFVYNYEDKDPDDIAANGGSVYLSGIVTELEGSFCGKEFSADQVAVVKISNDVENVVIQEGPLENVDMINFRVVSNRYATNFLNGFSFPGIIYDYYNLENVQISWNEGDYYIGNGGEPDTGFYYHVEDFLDDQKLPEFLPTFGGRIAFDLRGYRSDSITITGIQFSNLIVKPIEQNSPPVISPIGNPGNGGGDEPNILETSEGLTLEFSISATDPDEGDTLTYSADGLPSGASFNSETGTFSWTPGYDQQGTYDGVTFCVADSGDPPESACESITISVGNVNRPPIFTPILPVDVQEESLIEFTVIATDPDVGDFVELSCDNLPYGASFDVSTGDFSWAPNYNQRGNYVITFTAKDDGVPIEKAETESIITVSDIPPEELLNKIIDQIDSYSLDDIDRENLYIVHIKNAIDLFNKGKYKPAVVQLENLKKFITDDISYMKIDSDFGLLLLDITQEVLNNISQ